MNQANLAASDPELDLVLERVIDVPTGKVWTAWTNPDRLKRWFTPKPWEMAECEIDLRPGGLFKTVMRSPEGQLFPNLGCYLAIEPERRLIFTGVLGAGFRPVAVPLGMPAFTAIVDMVADGSGTRYRATAIHGDAASRAAHHAMGFQTGWGMALDQLVALCKAGDD